MVRELSMSGHGFMWRKDMFPGCLVLNLEHFGTRFSKQLRREGGASRSGPASKRQRLARMHWAHHRTYTCRARFVTLRVLRYWHIGSFIMIRPPSKRQHLLTLEVSRETGLQHEPWPQGYWVKLRGTPWRKSKHPASSSKCICLRLAAARSSIPSRFGKRWIKNQDGCRCQLIRFSRVQSQRYPKDICWIILNPGKPVTHQNLVRNISQRNDLRHPACPKMPSAQWESRS